MKWLVSLFVILAVSYPGLVSAETNMGKRTLKPSPNLGWSFSTATKIPIQSGGRVKPLDSFAREMVLFETGSRSFEGWNPIEMLFSMLSMPEAWQDYRFIQVSREDVRRQVGLDKDRTRFSPRELIGNPLLARYARSSVDQEQRASMPIADSEKSSPREQELNRVFERLSIFKQIISGESLSVIPNSNAALPWTTLASGVASADPIRNSFIQMVQAYQRGDEARFESASSEARAAIEARIPAWTNSARSRMEVEAFYSHARPFLWSWILYCLASLIWIAGLRRKRAWRLSAFGATGAAAFVQVLGISMRCYVAGRPPVTNMYESIIWVSLGVVAFASVLYAIHRQGITLLVANVLATFGLIAADSAPAMMDPSLNPLVPVLRSNYWLTIHVLTITLGYAAFALTLGLANVSLFHFLRSDRPGAKFKIASMNQLTYRAMQFGVVLIAAGTILGGVWADYSWGRFWGWDPKEVWALIVLLCYLVILHGRFAGWVGQFGFAVSSVISFLSVLMAWYGVNFVLGVGLHSYGFSSGGFGAISTFVALQLFYVGIVAWVYKRHKNLSSAVIFPAAADGTKLDGAGLL